jgi:hypothetical protein
MHQAINPLQVLAVRAGQGDRAALTELHQELEPSMAYIVRRAMRTRSGASPLTRQIRQTAQAVAAEPSRPSQGLVERITRCLSASLFGRLRAGVGRDHRQLETVHG